MAVKIILLLMIIFFFYGCSSKYNIVNGNLATERFLDYIEYASENNILIEDWYTSDWYTKGESVEYRNENIYEVHIYDRAPIVIKNRKDGNLEYHFSHSLKFSQGYYDYYFIVNKKTKKIIDWNFNTCDKHKMIKNEKEFDCLKNTRVLKNRNLYDISINHREKLNYGYKYIDLIDNTDDIKIVLSILNKKNLCNAGVESIIDKNI